MSTRKRKANPRYEDKDDKVPTKCAKPTSETPTRRTPALRKRKANLKYDDEDEDSIVDHAKITSETPMKRTPASRNRKANPRYEDEEEEEFTVKPAKITSQTLIKRMSAPRAVKVKRGDPDWLVTNEKSSLAYDDLHVSPAQAPSPEQ